MRRQAASFDIHGLPRIETFEDLAVHARLSGRQLWWLLFAGHKAYTTFRIAKKTGGFRPIAHPIRMLRSTQRWILRSILDKLHTTPSSYGFERGSKLRYHAEQHRGARAILTVDIENFFSSISMAQVTQVFRVAGYPSPAASMLARLCTCMGALPQGAPSSPRLANLVCFRMDRRLAQFAERRGIVYTRYADDLSFSSSCVRVLARARPFISHIVHDAGFRLNRRKSRLVGPRSRKTITGLVLASETVGIGRQQLRELRARIHRAHTGRDTLSLDAIQGWLDYVSDADPARYRILVRYIERLRANATASGLERLRVRADID
ncbi:retron St85 family RNA-directed DNA polymerase [Sorangium sp. So ce145]|uniref:retron St85 family RNA-directed DNA polymerase n=1 Tax=Sorangium sp. So ce145 TaxID=3133285 RepID=UPI003F629D28